METIEKGGNYLILNPEKLLSRFSFKEKYNTMH
jgi:hypothetical protein